MKDKEWLLTHNDQMTKNGDKVVLIRRYCKCGHSLNFVKRRPATCTYCGRLVYPDDKYEFQEKLKKEIRKHEQVYI